MKETIKIEEELKEKIKDVTGCNVSEQLSLDDITGIIEDIICEYHRLEEEFEDYKENVRDNYRQISISEQVGISATRPL